MEIESDEQIRDRMYDYESDVCPMDESDIDTDTHSETETEVVEEEDNLRDLYRIHEEATYLLTNNLKPIDEWYTTRLKYIEKYSELGWEEMANRFRNKDNIVYDLCMRINMYIDDILQSYNKDKKFDFSVYYSVLCNIVNLWKHYSEKFVGQETDTDIIDLVEGLAFL